MRFIEIQASWSETASLPNYSNVKPGITMKAVLEEGDDPKEVYQSLLDTCKAVVREAVDQALEFEGKPAKYSTEPRFDIFLRTFPYTTIRAFIVPANTDMHAYCEVRAQYMATGLRLDHALQKVITHRPSLVIVDCSDGDLSRIAPIIAQAQATSDAVAAVREAERDARMEQEADDREDDRYDDEDDEDENPF